MLTGIDAAKMHPTLVNTSSYATWALDNQHVIV